MCRVSQFCKWAELCRCTREPLPHAEKLEYSQTRQWAVVGQYVGKCQQGSHNDRHCISLGTKCADSNDPDFEGEQKSNFRSTSNCLSVSGFEVASVCYPQQYLLLHFWSCLFQSGPVQVVARATYCSVRQPEFHFVMSLPAMSLGDRLWACIQDGVTWGSRQGICHPALSIG